MIAAGVFSSKDPVFLWRGQLVEKMTKGPPHNIAATELHSALYELIPAGWFVQKEQPIVFSDDTEPEPDLTVVRGAIRDYADRPPAARDVVLLVEVSDSSLAVDSGEVLEKYAQEAIPCYWLVNIPHRRVEVYRRPEGGRYAERQVFGPDDQVPVVLDGREVGQVAVRHILP
jgi:Uma2 family endonuclease